MKDQDKTKDELISELAALRKHIDEKKKLQIGFGDIEESFKVSEEKYKTLYENAPLSYQSLDVDGNFIDINPAWLRTLGYTREEVIEKYYADFLHPDWKQHFEKNFPEFKRVGYVHDVQFKIRHKDGHYLDILLEGCIGYYPDGKVRQTYCVFQDITKRKLAEYDLLHVFQHLKAAEEIAELGYYENNLNTGKIYWSEGMIKLLGYKPNEIETNAESFIDLIHPDDKDAEIEKIQNAIKSENKFNSEFRFIKRNGDIGWLHTIGETGRNEQSELINKGILQDITERKLAEQKLLASEEKFRFLTENSRDMIYRMTIEDGEYKYVSPASIELYGYTPDEFYESPVLIQKIIHPDWKNYFEEEWTKLLSGEISPTYEYQIIHKSGETRWLHQRNVLIKDTSENL